MAVNPAVAAPPMARRRVRLLAVGGVLLLAPVTAELIQAYLGGTGDVVWTAFAVVFLAPMYGGAALLVREVAVRTGRGWPGRLLLAAAFGVLMATFVDGSLFTPHRDEIPYWDLLVGAATIGDLSLYAAQSWVTGHVVMSVGAPLAVVESLLPESRGRRWLGAWALVVTVLAGTAVAWLVHIDPDAPPTTATATDYLLAGVVVLLLVGLAMTPLGRPLPMDLGRRAGRPRVVGAVAFGAVLLLDLWPSWPGLFLNLTVLCIGGVAIARRSRALTWDWRHTGAVVTGVLVANALKSFTNPVPDGADPAAKLAQNLVVLLLVAALGVLIARRNRAEDSAAIRP